MNLLLVVGDQPKHRGADVVSPARASADRSGHPVAGFAVDQVTIVEDHPPMHLHARDPGDCPSHLIQRQRELINIAALAAADFELGLGCQAGIR